MSFTVAIIGRPNVGKSTLFNRLTGTQHALVDDQPGVTRDWKMGEAEIGPMKFQVIDTAGLEESGKASLESRMFEQTEQALSRANIALFLVDARAGITPQDEVFANWLRKSGKPVILGVNKAEGGKAAQGIIDAFSLGLGEAIPLSAAHGEGLADLFAAFEPHWKASGGDLEDDLLDDDAQEDFDPDAEVELDESKPVQIAIIGRPNAGKSTLLNCLLNEKRVLTGPEAGITRDAIAVDYEYKGRKLKLVDTAGMRRKANVVNNLEKLAVGDALRVIRYAHVVVVLLDAEIALEKQDLALIALAEREGRGVVIGINKWDLITEKDEYMKVTFNRLAAVVPQLKGVSVVPLSAERGHNVEKLIDTALDVYRLWNTRLPTSKLNRFLESALEQHAPPIVSGKRIKIRYATQIKTRPPTVALFTNNVAGFPDHYKRYLQNGIREAFKLPGVTIRVVLRKGKNPYA